MISQFRPFFCTHCNRSVPRAALRCLWCLERVEDASANRAVERYRPSTRAVNDDDRTGPAAAPARMTAQGMDRIGDGVSNPPLAELPTRVKTGG